jgi:hypothetical protein
MSRSQHLPAPMEALCAGGRVVRGMDLALPALGCGVGAFWMGLKLGWPTSLALPLAALVAAAAIVLAHRCLPRRPASLLKWDGQRWLLDGQACRPQIRLDMQAALIVHCPATGRGPGHWLFFGPDSAPGRWPLWRAALLAAQAPRDSLKVGL